MIFDLKDEKVYHEDLNTDLESDLKTNHIVRLSEIVCQ